MSAAWLCRRARVQQSIAHLAHLQRGIQTSAQRSRAIAQESNSSSHLSAVIPPFASSRQQDLRNGRASRTDGLSPFGARASNVNVLEPNTTHTISWDGRNLLMSRSDSGEAPTTISQWWLRDHCPCSNCMNQITKQRQVNHLKGSRNAPRASNVHLPADSPLFHVEWTDGHKSTFERDFVFRRNSSALTALRRGDAPLHLWGAEIAQRPPSVPYSEVHAGNLGPLMANLRRFGMCFISGTPVDAEASKTMLAQIGPIRETHWGGFTIVTSDLTSKDTAWTSEALEPHNDNTYFSEAAGLQMLHLLSHTDGTGGASLFVDGFAAAQQLYASSPAHYHTLATIGIHAHSTGNEGVNIQPSDALPVLRHDYPSSHPSSLQQVRWNNADRAGLACPMSETEKWYEAASAFQAILLDPKNLFEIQLRPGTPVIFDNWRLLHGRTAFGGKRTVCGGYVAWDDYISRYRVSCYSEEERRAATISG